MKIKFFMLEIYFLSYMILVESTFISYCDRTAIVRWHFSQHKSQLLQSFAFDQIVLILYSERLSSLIIFCLPYLSQTYDYSVRPWLSLEQNTNEYLIILIIEMYDLLYINKNNFILIFDIFEVFSLKLKINLVNWTLKCQRKQTFWWSIMFYNIVQIKGAFVLMIKDKTCWKYFIMSRHVAQVY